jgi:hypothetical protein
VAAVTHDHSALLKNKTEPAMSDGGEAPKCLIANVSAASSGWLIIILAAA